MKKSLKTLVFALASLFVMPFAVDAATITYEDIPNDSYVIGAHVFTRESGALTVKKIMLASQTIEGRDLDSMQIIYKDIMGNLFEVSAGRDADTNKYPEADVELTDEIQYDYYDLVTDLSEVIEAKANTILSEYYNKYTNGKIITPSDAEFNQDSFYILVGEYSGETLDEITINDATYAAGDKYLSIGMNAWIKAPVWKVEGEKLYVAALWVMAESLPGKVTVVTAGDQSYKANTFATSVEENDVTIKSVHSLYTVEGKVNTVNLDGTTVKHVSSDGRHAVGIILQNNGVDVVNADDVVYRLDQNGNMGITVPNAENTTLTGSEKVTVTYAVYPYYYAGEYPETAVATVYNYKLAIPGEGVVNFTLDFEPITTPSEE